MWTDCSSCGVTLLVRPWGNKSVFIQTVITCQRVPVSLVARVKAFLSAAEFKSLSEIREIALTTRENWKRVSYNKRPFYEESKGVITTIGKKIVHQLNYILIVEYE